MSAHEREASRRWRLILGSFSKQDQTDSANEQASHGVGSDKLNSVDQERDMALAYLYEREYQQRGHANESAEPSREGGNSKSRLTPTQWLSKVRKVFPKSTIEHLQKQAVDRYGLVSLLTDREVLNQSKPSMELVQTLLSFKNYLPGKSMDQVREIIRQVCAELERRLSKKIASYFSSKRLRHIYGGKKQLSNLDWSRSVRRNLHNYDKDEDTLILEHLYFYKRQENHIPWDFYILVDQSGSMSDSIIHSAVMASIFCKLKAINTHLMLFDTQVVDLTSLITDPVEALLSVQLGGGTNIGAAVAYAAEKISQPRRSMLVLISDFYEGGDANYLYANVQYLKDSGVSLLGLAALDQQSNPIFDENTAQSLEAVGMPVTAMTPDYLAQWVANNIGKT